MLLLLYIQAWLKIGFLRSSNNPSYPQHLRAGRVHLCYELLLGSTMRKRKGCVCVGWGGGGGGSIYADNLPEKILDTHY